MNIIDQLSMVDDHAAAFAAHRVLDTIQSHTPGVQVAAVAYLFRAMCEHFNRDPRMVLLMIDRMTVDSDKKERPHYRAIKAYLKGEMT